MPTRTGLTIEQFLAADWPPHTQLIDGEVVMSDPRFDHGEVTMRMVFALRHWITYGGGYGRAGSEGNWTVAPRQVFKPDVWCVPGEQIDSLRGALRSDAPPAIVGEVWSPSTWRYDTGRKREVYEQVGVAELWLVDSPRQAVTILRRSTPESPTFDVAVELGEGDSITSPLLDGFSLDVAGLFTD